MTAKGGNHPELRDRLPDLAASYTKLHEVPTEQLFTGLCEQLTDSTLWLFLQSIDEEHLKDDPQPASHTGCRSEPRTPAGYRALHYLGRDRLAHTMMHRRKIPLVVIATRSIPVIDEEAHSG